jgi:lysine 2,3-aminomutase
MRQLRSRVSGLCLPDYMLDIPGGAGKVPVGPSYIFAQAEAGVYHVRAHDGGVHAYPPAVTSATRAPRI